MISVFCAKFDLRLSAYCVTECLKSLNIKHYYRTFAAFTLFIFSYIRSLLALSHVCNLFTYTIAIRSKPLNILHYNHTYAPFSRSTLPYVRSLFTFYISIRSKSLGRLLCHTFVVFSRTTLPYVLSLFTYDITIHS
jgi:hypothetical protein